MAAKKKARKKNAKRRTHKRAANPTRRRRHNAAAPARRRRRHNPATRRRLRDRRRNPSSDGLIAAIVGGAIGRVIGTAGAEAGELATGPKHSLAKTGARTLGRLGPAIAAYVTRDKFPNAALGMAGAAGAGVIEEGIHHMLSKNRGTPPSWAKWVGGGSGHQVKLPNGGILYHDMQKGPMMLPPLLPGQVGPPAPVALPPATANGLVQMKGTPFTLRDDAGDHSMHAIGLLPSGSMLVRDRQTGALDTLKGDDLEGLVQMGGLVQVGEAIPKLMGDEEDEDEEDEEAD